MKSALVFREVVKTYGRRRALDGLDLEVPAGAVFGLVGSNGAGKTTSMTVAVGLLGIAGGAVDLLEAGAFRPAVHAGRVTLLPQDSRFPPHARVGDLLAFYARLQGLAPAEVPRAVDSLLDWVHLSDRRRAPVRTLSHGMRRRVAIAQAFLGHPELVLLDEPLSGLDPREAARVRELIRARRGQTTIVISSHVLTDIEALCDTVAFVERGRRVRQDALDRIIHRGGRMTYVLTPGPAPLAELQQALPAVGWTHDAARGELTAVITDGRPPAELNAQVLAMLLHAQVGVLEIRRGSDLESVYLDTHPADTLPAGDPPPLPAPRSTS